MHARRYVALLAALIVVFPATASAHVELSPDRIEPGAFTLFTVLSPNESAQALTGLQLTIPDALVVDSVADTPGFTTKVVEDEQHRIAGLSWQGGNVAAGRLALFHFSAAPRDTGLVELTGIQHFADGSTRLWHSPQVDVASTGGTSRDSLTLAVAVAALVLALVLGGGALAVALARRRSAAA